MPHMEYSSAPLENDDFQDIVISSRRKHAKIQSNELEIATRCPLCVDHWTNCGPHRIISLRCGHTFGEKCILDLIKADGTSATCPTCREGIRKAHLRPVWPNTIFQDNDTLINEMKKELDEAQAELEETIRRLDHTNSQYQQCRLALQEFATEQPIVSQDQPQSTSIPRSLDAADASFHLVDTKILSNERHVTRVMTIIPDEEMVVATMKQGNHSHGLYKVSLRDLRSCEYIGNHSGLVRDVKSSTNRTDNGNAMLLSTGFDKTLKLTSAANNCTVLSYALPLAGWSCEFNCADANQFYCGLSNNSLLVFDIRNTKEHLHQMFEKTASAPIHSMISCHLGSNHLPSMSSTLICGSLTHTYQWNWKQDEPEPVCTLFEPQEKGYTPYALAFDRKETSLMVSSRAPGLSKHTVIRPTFTEKWEIVWEYTRPQYQKNMTRTDLYEGLSCFSDDSGTIHLRNKDGSSQTIPAEPGQQIVDTKFTHIQYRHFLIALADNKVKLYNKHG